MTRWPTILLLLLTVAVILVTSVMAMRDDRNRTILNVGYLTAITGELKDKQGLAISGALTVALDEINNDDNILTNVMLSLRWNDTKGDTVLATKAITEMICDGIAVIFGPEGYCYVEAIVTQSRNIPMISYKCSENRASKIQTFARTEPPDTQVIKSVISLLRYYSWKKFTILHDEIWGTVADLLKEEAEKFNMTINHKEAFIDNMAKCCEMMLSCCRTGFWYQIVQNTMNRTRIYVFLGTANALVDFMASMDTANLFSRGEYMVIFVDMMTYTPKEAEKYLRKPDQVERMITCDETESFTQRARSLLVVASTPPTDSYENFTAKVRDYNSRKPFNFVLPSLFHSNNYIKFVSIYAAYLYDSVRLYAWALDKLLREKNRDLTDEEIHEVASNGNRIIETIINNRTYKSVTGATINIDSNGDSEGNFSVLAYKPYKYLYRDNLLCNYHMVPVAYFQQGRDIPEYKLINGTIRVDWPSGGERPFDEPMCGFANELCKKDDRHLTSVVAAGILGLILFCSGVVTMSIYRKWKIELEIEGLLWKIDISEIKGYFGKEIVSSPSKLSLISVQSLGSRCSNQVFTSTARLRGAVVRIKELRFLRKKDMSRELMKEMRLLRELRHDNVNSFIGACVETTRILLVTDYCAKGSLYDIIENEDIKLDDLFIASLIHDLIKGMMYIHGSSLVFHGNLKSSNCVVTSRWMLQVTDFGLHDLRHSAESESIGEHQHYRSKFWKAPEILRNPNIYGSQKADVYAFAIIMYEIFSRKGPFGQTAYEPKQIIDLVKKHPIEGDVPFRPQLQSIIDGELCPDYVLNCITDCWHEDPDIRPDFPTIRNRLKKMRGGKTKNIMDQMMEMMEKYANNLEDIVTERTRLLCEEKRKTEDLLHRMLPQSVAEKLTMGLGVEPVSYDLVTIYFSDIVGFTALSAESTPLQVVNFLNDLYTVFDRIIRGYDVYKVETIGDAYMVVSGLPIKNGNQHAGEIASMALELLQAVKQHRIAHRPNEVLKLRIGMHTGPVVAGVVGLTMPRYCLFGDTVNTASRMESNGEALKIHISSNCKEALDKLDGYITEKRGLVHMKGKGEVTTYWLVGATEKAIQKKPVDVTDLPPPLFCRPRKSPKLNCDSRHPSIIGMQYIGRQSSVPRADIESTYSLQGSLNHFHRDSPYMNVKMYDRQLSNTNAAAAAAAAAAVQGSSIPDCIGYYEYSSISGAGTLLDIAHVSHNSLKHSEFICDSNNIGADVSSNTNKEGVQASRKPLAMVRPHRRINSAALTNYMCLSRPSSQHNLREAYSLDLMPLQLRKRYVSIKCQSMKTAPALDTTPGISLIPTTNTIVDDNKQQHQSMSVEDIMPISMRELNENIRYGRNHRTVNDHELDDNDNDNDIDDDNIGLLMYQDNNEINTTYNTTAAAIVPIESRRLNRRRSSGSNSYHINCSAIGKAWLQSKHKHNTNNCNGGCNMDEDAAHTSLLSPSVIDSNTIEIGKRWHSLETLEHHTDKNASYSNPVNERQTLFTKKKKVPSIWNTSGVADISGGAGGVSVSGSGGGGGGVGIDNAGANSTSFFDRFVSLFQNNDKPASESSLGRVDILSTGASGVPAFSNIGGVARDRESIV